MPDENKRDGIDGAEAPDNAVPSEDKKTEEPTAEQSSAEGSGKTDGGVKEETPSRRDAFRVNRQRFLREQSEEEKAPDTDSTAETEKLPETAESTETPEKEAGAEPGREKTSSFAKDFFAVVLYIITGILVFVVSMIAFSARWTFTNWGDIDVDEIIFQLSMPFEGTGNGMLADFFVKTLIPSGLILIAFIVALIILKKGKRRIILSCAFLAACAVMVFIVYRAANNKLELSNWIEGQKNDSVFIEENYVDPKDVKLKFPDRKRNLIYIYLESMETTYADEKSGGAFPRNMIPELTKIAEENEDFSGSRKELNGGVIFPGTGYTSGAIFAQTAGLPLKISIGVNEMDTQDTFFPDIVALGDILASEGYRQVFQCGSNATFGGRRNYLRQHGNFEIRDHLYAQKVGWIEPDYSVWWGMEDEILFDSAKKTLQELAKGNKPFNFTMLTTDTHFEDGYVCDLCRTEFGDDQYANVMACSSRQVSRFLSWIQQQDFYENTTIILAGDHTTMDKDFCNEVDREYVRKTYTAVVNSAASVEDPEAVREYSTFDLFPTTLAAMGVSIKGDRLGLGTNLYSSKKTLQELFGREREEKELSRKSLFLEELETVNTLSDSLFRRYRDYYKNALRSESYDRSSGRLKIRLHISSDLGIPVDHYEAEYQEAGTTKTEKLELKPDAKVKGDYIGTIDLSSWKKPLGEIRLNMYVVDGETYENIDTLYVNYTLPEKSDVAGYFREMANHPEYTVFLAANKDMATGMTEEMAYALQQLGVINYLPYSSYASYIAVIENGSAVEYLEYAPLHYDGYLASSGETYAVESAGYYNGSYASIVIDGIEYAPNKPGLNIVVYDNELKQVIDSGCFDLAQIPPPEEQAPGY